MPIISLTLIIGLCLVFTFLIFFLLEQNHRRLRVAERAEPPSSAGEMSQATFSRVAAPHVCINNGSCDSCRARAERLAAKASRSPIADPAKLTSV
jgi:hypothetical protein